MSKLARICSCFPLANFILLLMMDSAMSSLYLTRNFSQFEDPAADFLCKFFENADDFARCMSMRKRLINDRATASVHIMRNAISEYTQRHSSLLNETNSVERKFLVCEPYGGIGNVLAALASCFLVALASGRAFLVSWDAVGTRRSWSPPYEVPLSEFLLPPAGLDWSFDAALRRLPELQTVDPRKDVQLSGWPRTRSLSIC
jgi:hypothetical protein